jgi:uncharacterized phage protein (TIGR02216 family)
MALGLGALKLAPPTFWAMTPRELDAALSGHFGRARVGPRMTASVLAALMQAHPDQPLTEEATNAQ